MLRQCSKATPAQQGEGGLVVRFFTEHQMLQPGAESDHGNGGNFPELEQREANHRQQTDFLRRNPANQRGQTIFSQLICFGVIVAVTLTFVKAFSSEVWRPPRYRDR